MVMVTGPRQSGKTTTLRHLFGKTHRYVSLEPPDTRAAAPLATKTLWDRLLRGGYPELVAEPRRDPVRWHASYVQTYLERDVRSLRQVGDLTQFQMFLRALAARSGQLLNLADVSRDLGVALNTAKAWLSVLEATDQVFVLRPYYANLGKRLVKTPKVYFTDTGTLCYLVGLRDVEHARSGPLGGALFETAVLCEVVRSRDGIYRSPDAGRTWTHLGLRDGQAIPAIRVDRRDPNRLFAAVLGHPFGPNPERGIFRSTDGGQTWGWTR